VKIDEMSGSFQAGGREAALVFHMPGHGLHGGAASEFAFDHALNVCHVGLQR
jgi:hypothetical protein